MITYFLEEQVQNNLNGDYNDFQTRNYPPSQHQLHFNDDNVVAYCKNLDNSFHPSSQLNNLHNTDNYNYHYGNKILQNQMMSNIRSEQEFNRQQPQNFVNRDAYNHQQYNRSNGRNVPAQEFNMQQRFNITENPNMNNINGRNVTNVRSNNLGHDHSNNYKMSNDYFNHNEDQPLLQSAPAARIVNRQMSSAKYEPPQYAVAMTSSLTSQRDMHLKSYIKPLPKLPHDFGIKLL